MLTTSTRCDKFCQYWIAGEAWQFPLISRTTCALAELGIDALAIDHWEAAAAAPLTYEGIIKRILQEVDDNISSLVIPAGIVPNTNTLACLNDVLLKHEQNGDLKWLTLNLARPPKQPFFIRKSISGGGEYILFGQIGRDWEAIYHPDFETANTSEASTDQCKKFIINRGASIFQSIQEFQTPFELERPLQILNRDIFPYIPKTKVFRANTESIPDILPEAEGYEILIAVASGMKPWYLANELRQSLRQLILIDASASQLRFAYEASNSIATAQSWSQICENSGFPPHSKEKNIHQHDLMFHKLREGQPDWRFETTYLLANIHAQTMRLLDALTELHSRKVVLWYSNIFQPNFNNLYSENHHYVEQSFLRMITERIPNILAFGSQRAIRNKDFRTDCK